LKKAIIARLIALTAAAIAVCGLISSVIFALRTQDQTEEWLARLTTSAAERYQTGDNANDISKMSGGLRVTVIAPGGAVLSDSEADAAQMENHADREEVKNAKEGSVYIDMRRSGTLGKNFMYASVKTQDGIVVRLSYSYAGLVPNIAAQLPAVLAAAAVALVLSLFLAGRFARDVTGPLEHVAQSLSADPCEPLGSYPSRYPEIGKTLQGIHRLLKQGADSRKSLLAEREKVEVILSGMAEGFILLDSEKKILLCNQSAKGFFGLQNDANAHGMTTLLRDARLLAAVDNAVQGGQSSTVEIKPKSGLVLRVSVSPAPAGDEPGATVMLVDITAERKLEKQKADFFSNASHELKTPITSILGFSELLNQGAVEGEAEKKEVLRRIEKEAGRMSGLINDILMISNLESKAEPTEYAAFDFSEVIKEVAASISPIKEGAPVAIDLQLEPVTMLANVRQLRELCANLIENAVKYNKPGGSVTVSLNAEGKTAVLTVRDTGVGIPEKYQQRVFERFFRVDSGRDKRAGGTGLGLSIVKHIVGLYDGEISLESKLGEGTKIEIRLPAAGT
jgi:two-component system phosphate regulon sensor histidine kinase PhoR